MSDLKIAFRLLRKAPGLALVAVACLSVGIGLTTAVFHVVYGAFLSPLPVDGGDRIVMVREYHRAGRYNVSTTPEQFHLWQQRATSFDALGAWQVKNIPIQTGHTATVVRAAYVSASALEMVAASPRLGRSITADDAAPGATPVIVLSDAVWRSQFNADTAVLGRMVRVSGQALVVIGVMPERFAFPVREQVWIPLPDAVDGVLPAGDALQVFAKLKPGISAATGQAELATLRKLEVNDPMDRSQTDALLRPFTRGYMSEDEEWAVYGVLLGLLLFLLVMAGNLSNLLLARNSVRVREIAVRHALGASRARLIRQLLMEAALLGGGSAVLGLLLARGSVAYVVARVGDLPWWFTSDFAAATPGFALLAAVLASGTAGIAPALKLTRSSVNDMLKETHLEMGGVRFGRLSQALIVVQMAIAIGFVSAVGLLAQSLFGFSYEKYGLPAREILVAQLYFGQPEGIAPQMGAAERRAAWNRFLDECQRKQQDIANRMAAIPGVSEAAYASLLPGNDVESTRIELEPAASPRGAETQPVTRIVEIGPSFFPVLGARPIYGREFLPSEHEGEPRAVIVNEPFARKHWGGNALGRRLRLLPSTADGEPGPWLEVVGVVADLGLNPGDSEHADGIYVPLSPTNVVRLAIRSTVDPGVVVPTLHETVALAAPRAQVQWAHPLEEQVRQVVTVFRSLGSVLLLIGATALLLSAVSLYSLVSFNVTRRTREIGIRIALGGTRRAILGGVFRREGMQVLTGVALGAGLAAILTRLIRLLPFGLRIGEPQSLAVLVALLVAVGLMACLAPLRRALAIQPTEALRHE